MANIKLKDIQLSLGQMLGVITSIFSVLAALYFMGNSVWASDEEVSQIKEDVVVMGTDIKYIKKIFEDAIKLEANKVK